MKGYYDMKWPLHLNAMEEPETSDFDFEYLENKMGIKIPKDLKEFLYMNSLGVYPDKDNYWLYDKHGKRTIGLYGPINSYLDSKEILETLEIRKDDLGEIYYWHLPLMEIGHQEIILDYTECKENPPVVWINEEIGPYEGELGDPHWKRYIAPTFKDFIEMIGDRNKPVGDWIDQNLMADGTRAGDE